MFTKKINIHTKKKKSKKYSTNSDIAEFKESENKSKTTAEE